jgi:hypothetical protein
MNVAESFAEFAFALWWEYLQITYLSAGEIVTDEVQEIGRS